MKNNESHLVNKKQMHFTEISSNAIFPSDLNFRKESCSGKIFAMVKPKKYIPKHRNKWLNPNVQC